MKQAYEHHNFKPEALAVIDQANQIVASYQAQGYTLTLRQLYYQFVARDLLANRQQNYKRLGDIIVKARLAGLVDWDAIEDRTRHLRSFGYWDDIPGILRSTYRAYTVDPWEHQPTRVEVWVEKDALMGVLDDVCTRLDTPYFSCRGYVSWSEMYTTAQRIKRRARRDVETVILHLGDHDPSGVQMTEDIRDRLWRLGTPGITVERIALTMEQVEQYDPPPNPAKLTDSRASGYISEYGYDSWELDALEPSVLDALIEEHTLAYRDGDLYQAAMDRQWEGQEQLRNMIEPLLDS